MFIYFFEVSIAGYVTTRARERETDFFLNKTNRETNNTCFDKKIFFINLNSFIFILKQL